MNDIPLGNTLTRQILAQYAVDWDDVFPAKPIEPMKENAAKTKAGEVLRANRHAAKHN